MIIFAGVLGLYSMQLLWLFHILTENDLKAFFSHSPVQKTKPMAIK